MLTCFSLWMNYNLCIIAAIEEARSISVVFGAPTIVLRIMKKRHTVEFFFPCKVKLFHFLPPPVNVQTRPF